MRNVRETQKRNCLIFTHDELAEILSELFNDEITGSINEGYLEFTNEETDILDKFEIKNKLEEYFDIKISSMHIDDHEYPLIWIVYTDFKEI